MMKPFPYSLQRWWQNMGFGIQSKTDYSFLKDVLREHLPYYIYDDLRREYPQFSNKAHRQAQLLFRICYHFRNERILFIGRFNELDRKAIEHASPHNVEFADDFYHKIVANVIIMSGIYEENIDRWFALTQGNIITFDMVDLGIVISNEDRYPEHYKILRP